MLFAMLMVFIILCAFMESYGFGWWWHANTPGILMRFLSLLLFHSCLFFVLMRFLLLRKDWNFSWHN